MAVLFPNMESALRLGAGVIIEIHEEWAISRQYLNRGVSDERWLIAV